MDSAARATELKGRAGARDCGLSFTLSCDTVQCERAFECVQYPRGPKGGIGSPGLYPARVQYPELESRGGCEPLVDAGSPLDPLQGQPVC